MGCNKNPHGCFSGNIIIVRFAIFIVFVSFLAEFNRKNSQNLTGPETQLKIN
jgi:hypothetical protein